MDLRRTRRLYWWGVALAVGVLLCGMWCEDRFPQAVPVLVPLGLVLFLAANVAALFGWRCPRCGRMLPMRGLWSIAYCPHCGDELFPQD